MEQLQQRGKKLSKLPCAKKTKMQVNFPADLHKTELTWDIASQVLARPVKSTVLSKFWEN